MDATAVGFGAHPRIQVPEAFADLFTPARYKAFYGGRGSAKSWTVARVLIAMAAERKLRILCGREIQNSIRDSVKKLIDDQIDAMGYRGFFKSTDTEIRGINGSVFLFKGFRGDPETIKSLEGVDIVWLEEARNISQPSLDALIPTVRKPGSEIWATWNRKFANDPIDRMFLGGKPPPRAVIREVSWRDNPWFPDVLDEERRWDKSRDREKWLHIWEGGLLTVGDAVVFKNWTIDRFDLPEQDVVFLFGADWGFAVDPTVLVRAFADDPARKLYVDFEAYKVGCDIDKTPALFAGSDVKTPPRWNNPHGWEGVPGALRHKIVADSARPETISYMKARGFRMEGAKKGAGSIEDGIEFLKGYDIVVHPRCQHVIDELTHYRFKIDPLTEDVLPVLADKKNNTIDALRYSVEAIRRAKKFFA